MSKVNAFALLMNSAQQISKKTKTGFSILKGLKVEEEACHLLQFDGLSKPNPGVSTGGAVLFSPSRKIIFERGEFIEFATNNQAEYTGLRIGLESCVELGIKHLLVEGDSKLVICQTEGIWKVSNEELKVFNKKIKELVEQFESIAIRHIYRKMNSHADRITNDVLRSKESFFKRFA
jgi:ribonuclease HI